MRNTSKAVIALAVAVLFAAGCSAGSTPKAEPTQATVPSAAPSATTPAAVSTTTPAPTAPANPAGFQPARTFVLQLASPHGADTEKVTFYLGTPSEASSFRQLGQICGLSGTDVAVPFAFTVTATTAAGPVQTGFRFGLDAGVGTPFSYANQVTVAFAPSTCLSITPDVTPNYLGGMSNGKQANGQSYQERGLVIVKGANDPTNDAPHDMKGLTVDLMGTMPTEGPVTDPVQYGVTKVLSATGDYSRIPWQYDYTIVAFPIV